jgi:hypothetical protein
MVTPRIIKLFRMQGTNGNSEKIYCRRHNRLYSRCPVEENIRQCECLAQCEMSLKAGRQGPQRSTGSN